METTERDWNHANQGEEQISYAETHTPFIP